jgi:hypothetical protein
MDNPPHWTHKNTPRIRLYPCDRFGLIRCSENDWNGANLNARPLDGEWLLSRRDRLIVARHEVPG